MYSHEIQQLIDLRNGILGGDELLIAISPQENHQLNHITYDSGNMEYKMWDNIGQYFHFKAMDYEEAKTKGLVKEKKGTIWQQ